MKKTFLLCLILLLSACTSSVNTNSTPTPTFPTATVTAAPIQTTALTPSPTTIPVTPTQTDIPFHVCCPLEDETFESMLQILTKPLDIPPFGQDVGHHGMDFAYFSRGERKSIQGIEIYAILPGQVVLTLEDEYPYGYTVLIETPLSRLPEVLQEALLLNYLPVPEDPNYRLNCPDVNPPTLTGDYSIYHLYAHMETKPSFSPGDSIACGEKIGTVGDTGWSSNPHLHLETRLGPSGATLQSMCHYQSSCTVEKMAHYCLWRMSGYYQLFDPFIIFNYWEQ